MRGLVCSRTSIHVDKTSILNNFTIEKLDFLSRILTLVLTKVVKLKPWQILRLGPRKSLIPKASPNNSSSAIFVCKRGQSLQCRAGMQPGIKGQFTFTLSPQSTLVNLSKENFKLRVKKIEILVKSGQKCSSSLLATNIG